MTLKAEKEEQSALWSIIIALLPVALIIGFFVYINRNIRNRIGDAAGGMFSFGKSKGAYAGLNLEGAVLDVRDGWNEAYYGKPVRPTDIFVTKSVSNSGSAELRKALAKADSGERMQPAKATTTSGEGYHVVQSGDTLWGISKEYGVSVAELRKLNGLSEGQNIYPGQKLRVK